MNDREILAEVSRSMTMEADELRALTSELDGEKVVAVAKALMKVILSGCGTSAMAAKKIAHSLNCIEIPALFLTPSDAVHGGLGVLQGEDVLILISKGGNTEELVQLIPPCRRFSSACRKIPTPPSRARRIYTCASRSRGSLAASTCLPRRARWRSYPCLIPYVSRSCR